MKILKLVPLLALSAAAIALAPMEALASSHREAPLITTMPKEDNTDVYMFRSYESGRQGFVTIVANYQPFEDPFAGPNYYTMDPRAAYDINIDNNGDGKPEMTFRFQFTNTYKNLSVPVGGQNIPVPLINIGPTTDSNTANLNVTETYTVNLIRSNGKPEAISCDNGQTAFTKPTDNIGVKSFPDYESYANQYIYDISIPECSTKGRLFVGQRKDPFVVNLGETFDLVNISNPVGPPDEAADALAGKNVTSLIMEVPISCLVENNSQPIIGAWATASLPNNLSLNPQSRKARPDAKRVRPNGNGQGDFVQVSRLGMPLVNELVIGLKDKDTFNSSQPKDDAQFLQYVTNPSVPALIQILFPNVTAPTLIPRADLVATYLTGLQGVNQPPNVTPAEELRLNTGTPVTPPGNQDRLGLIDGDAAGFPNGRRPGDDVVDITLRVAMGALINPLKLFGTPDQAPSGNLPFTDGALVNSSFFDNAFPYLKPPLPGSPNGPVPNNNGIPVNGGLGPDSGS